MILAIRLQIMLLVILKKVLASHY